jgi:pimeloyl-ACP methyl ester carboxylesterase
MRGLVRVGLAAAVLAGCGVAAGCGQPGVPALAGAHRCDPDALGSVAPPPGVEFSCATLTVPLDHGLLPGAREDRRLPLRVAMTENATPRHGVLVWLNGGPGVPGVGLAGEVATQLDPAVLRDYRLVLFNQRGTGPTALECPTLQEAVGSSLEVAPADALEDCAREIGPDHRFFGSADTVADLEQLRQALGVDKLTLAGASYGTLPAARYAVTHPDRVARLVLDSVVPHDGLDPLMIDLYPRAAEVLREACARAGCATDPAADLAEVIRARHNGLDMLRMLTKLAAKPQLAELPAALREAARGDGRGLDTLTADALKPKGRRPPADESSRGLNVATSCQDMQGPWGGATTAVAGRAEAARKAVAALPDQAFFPFDRATALENGTVVACQRWPETPVPPFPAGHDLPPVPTLLLAGSQELTTPLGWTRREAARAPAGRLAVIPGAGHITQDLAAYGPAGRDAVTQFLITG